MENQDLEHEKLELERARLEHDRQRSAGTYALREREVIVVEAEQARKEAELELQRRRQAGSSWWNPLVVAILAATVAATGSAVVALINGVLERRIESQKSEHARILEMIKTGDPDKAAENLRFLLDAGLIDDPGRIGKLEEFLAKREPGTGPALSSREPIMGAPTRKMKVRVLDEPGQLVLSIHVGHAQVASYRVTRWDPDEGRGAVVAEGTNVDEVPDTVNLGEARDAVGGHFQIQILIVNTGSINELYSAKLSFTQAGELLPGAIDLSGVLSPEAVQTLLGTIEIVGPDPPNSRRQ